LSFQRQSIESILRKIEYSWQLSGASSSFIEVMRRALPFLGDQNQTDFNPLKWAALPAICCQAAGGDPRWVDGFAAAWLLYYVAAHIMDKVEDQDILEGPWQEWGPRVSINIASGLYFSASLLLSDLNSQDETHEIANEINGEFYRAFLLMCGGQQRDLTQPEPSLSDYWENANDKSGVFFSMACRLGARFATSDRLTLNCYEEFGRNIGILIQILDDLEDFQGSGEGFGKVSLQVIRRSLPVIYALDVLPDHESIHLQKELEQAVDGQSAAAAFKRIENSGATYYIFTELERLRSQARTSLERAQPEPHAERILFDLLGDLTYQF